MGMLITGRRVVLSREEGERGGSGLALIVGEKRGRREVEDQKKIEEELIMYKKEAMEHHEKGFNKAVR